MHTLKAFINRILGRFGYAITRIKAPDRRLAQAYYKGQVFCCFLDDPIGQNILTGKGWDPQLEEILQSLVQKDGDIVEVGANIGASLIPLAGSFPNYHFHCLEPVPLFHEILTRNLDSYHPPNVTLYQQAVGSKDGEQIHIHVGLGTAGLTEMVGYQLKDTVLSLTSATLDKFMGDKRIAFLKIDVDGHEANVLRGAEKILKEQRPAVFLEFATRVLDDLNLSPDVLINPFKEAGYRRIHMWDDEGTFLREASDWEDLVAEGRRAPHNLNIVLSG